jgi:membrane protein YqaA with SNARE-associated domain
MLGYALAFLGSFVVDCIPVFAPPAWTVMLGLLLRFELNPWLTAAVGAAGSTLGRWTLTAFMPKVAKKLLDRRKKDNIAFLGKKLGGTYWASFLFVLVYSLTPLSTTALFTAAGVAKVNVLPLLPAFLLGKFGSDALMLVTGSKAATSFKEIMKGQASPKSLIMTAAAVLLLGALVFVDWRQLLEKKRLRLTLRG